MTTVEIYKDKEENYKGFLCMGHADYAKKHLFYREPDIVCASISILIINTLNCMEELSKEKFECVDRQETGFLKVDFTNGLHEKSVFLMDAMVYGLQNIQKEYGEQYLLVRIKEV